MQHATSSSLIQPRTQTVKKHQIRHFYLFFFVFGRAGIDLYRIFFYRIRGGITVTWMESTVATHTSRTTIDAGDGKSEIIPCAPDARARDNITTGSANRGVRREKRKLEALFWYFDIYYYRELLKMVISG